MHGSIFHLLSNLYFLVVFGDNVEDLIGHTRFVIVLVLATLAGDVAHIALEPRSEVPCIGASGGISGLVLFYALAFPHARLYTAYRVGWYFRFFRLPAWLFALIWLALQVLEVIVQLSGAGDVSGLAHLGGAGAGYACWLWWRREVNAAPSAAV